MEKKVIISLKLEKNLHRQLQQRVIVEGYGMRGKSKWIIESIESLLLLDDYPVFVDIADSMGKLTDMITMRIPEKLVLRIEQSIVHIRRLYPTIEGVQSNLIRASIVQRLLRPLTSVTEV